MKPYGWRLGYWRDEDFGPPSKHGKLSSKHRREWRRVLHKQGRRDGERIIRRELEQT